MNLLKACYHEGAHALTCRRLGRRVHSIEVGLDAGVVRQEPLPPDASSEEIERGLTILFAGEIGATYAPVGPYVPDASAHADSNGGVPLAGVLLTAADGPEDEAVIEHFRERVGDEAAQRAEALAREFVERDAALGRLQAVADELYWRGALTGDELERILA